MRSAEFDDRHMANAGGCGLNCVANGKIIQEGIFDEIYVPSVPHDAAFRSEGSVANAYGKALQIPVRRHCLFSKSSRSIGIEPA